MDKHLKRFICIIVQHYRILSRSVPASDLHIRSVMWVIAGFIAVLSSAFGTAIPSDAKPWLTHLLWLNWFHVFSFLSWQVAGLLYATNSGLLA
jgi:hypothetical protein